MAELKKTIGVRIDVPEADHTALKVLVAQRRTTLQQIFLEMIRREVTEKPAPKK